MGNDKQRTRDDGVERLQAFSRGRFLIRETGGLILALLLGCLPGLAGIVRGDDAGGRHPGVEYHHLTEDGPFSIHAVVFDLARDDIEVAATVGKGIHGTWTVPDMAAWIAGERMIPLAGINGDYFEFRGEPRYFGTLQGMCMVNGELVAGPPATAFWVDAGGLPRIGRVASRLQVTWPDGTLSPFGLNGSTSDFKSEVRTAHIVLFTPAFGTSTHTDGGLELVLERAGPDTAWLPLRPNVKYTARIRSVHAGGNTPIPPGGMVLSIAGDHADARTSLQPGDVLEFDTDCIPDMTGVRAAISGDPALLADGQIVARPGTNRAPRTAVGMAGSRVWFVVVDGRQPSLSIGMTHQELAALMLRLGCTDALNLDGGGSSTLWYDGRVVNSPSAVQPRPVGNALFLLGR